MVITDIMDREMQISLQKLNSLRRLAGKANVVILLELFVALRLAEGNIVKMDRLSTAISYVQNYGNLNHLKYVQPFSLPALKAVNEIRQPILGKIFDVLDGLPLKWGPGTPYECYAPLPHSKIIELFYELLAQDDLKSTLGEHLVIARKYLHICTGLIELTHLKRMKICRQYSQDSSASWAPFIFSKPMLGDLLAGYFLIKDELPYVQLPSIEFFRLGSDHYLLSQELISGCLMTGFVHLKERIDTHATAN